MVRGINKYLSYLVIIAFLSTSTNISYLSQQESQDLTDTLRTQAAALTLATDSMQAKLESPGTEIAKTSSSGATSEKVSDVMVQSIMQNHTVAFIMKALDVVELKDLPATYKEFADNYKEGLLQEIGKRGLIALFQRLEEDANNLFKEGKEAEATNLYKSVIFFAKVADALIVHDDEFDWIGNISLLGGKIDNSLMLSKGRLEVPPFFGITSMFQKYVWLYNDLLPKMREIAFTVDPQNNTATSSAQARFEQLIRDTHVPEDLQSMLKVEARKIADREGYALTKEEADKLDTEAIEIIFRSSQGLEDRPGIPSAGIGSSIPTMGTDGMLDVLKDVAASAYLRRALEYRDKIAINTWLLTRMSLAELKHIVAKLKELAEATPRIEIGGIFYATNTIIEDLEANLSEDLRSRKEFVNISTLRVLTLLELLQQQSAKDSIIDKAVAEIRDVRIDCLDAARIGGGIQTQTMRSSEYSVVGFAVNKATGWTGDANDMIVIDYDIADGRGELIVQGSIISDHYKILINPKTGNAIILLKECGSKLATLKRVKPGTEVEVWLDTKYEKKETIIAEEGVEYLTVTPIERRQNFVVSDEKAIDIAHKILESNTVHNEGRPQVVPVDMEACYYHDTEGNLKYSIVQKRDSAIKSGFDFEDPDFVIHAGKEPVVPLADAAQEQGHMKAKGFETQNAASGVTVWVEEPSANRVKKAVEKIWEKADEDALMEFIPRAHPDLYSTEERTAIAARILKDRDIVETGIQDDFDIEGFDFDKARILERAISKDLSSKETIEDLSDAYGDSLDKAAMASLSAGVLKLFETTDSLEDRMRVLSTIIRVNIFSSPKGDLKKAFAEEHAGVLERDVLNRQFDKIKAMIKQDINVVMVTPETNPNFNDIMKLVDENGGATVTLQGGRSAHAIIISIQFGYCVVGGAEFNDSELLERIKNGEQLTLTIDGNKGQVYDVEIPITSFFSTFQPKRWGNYGGDIGLITNSPMEGEKAAKNHNWQVPVDHKMYPYMKGKESVGYYSVSLDRIEEILIELGLDFRGAYAYDRMNAIRAKELDETTLSDRQKSDVAKLRGRRDLIAKISKKINDKGFTSAVGYLRYELASHFKQMLATTKPGQVVQVRLRDLKKREILKTQDGAELFYNDEEASMIGDRGTGLEVHDENIEAIDLQLLALEDARIDAEKLGGLGDLGFMFVFIRRVLDDPELGIESDLKKGLNRLLQLRREGKIRRIPKQVGIMFELVINALLAEELAKTLADFREQVKEEFNEDIVTYFSNGTNDLTQSVKGSRDEGRYVSMDVLMPDGSVVKGIRIFYEGDPAVGDTIEHGAFVAKKYGHKRGSCGEYFNNLLTAGDIESITSALQGFARLDSAGTSIKVFPKAVKLLADSQLAKQRIPTNVAVKAKVVAEGESLFKKGAVHRTAVFIRSEDDFTTERIIYRDGGKNEETRYAPKTVEGDILILSSDMDPDSKKLLETLNFQASGVILVGRNGLNLEALQVLLKEYNIPTVTVKKDVFTRLDDLKQYVFDFERGAIYTENNISFVIEHTEDRTAYAHIDFTAEPEQVVVETVEMDDIYKAIGMHPLALALYALHTGETENSVVETIDGGQNITKLDKILSQQRIPLAKNRFPEIYKDVEELLAKHGVDTVEALISKITKEAIAEAKEHLSDGAILAFGTSKQDAWAFEELKWGKRETELELNVFNVPIDLRGLAKTISPGYGDIFEMFLPAVKEEGLDIQFNYIQDLNILDTAIEFIEQCGLIPGQDSFKLGMSASTSHNFIVANSYLNKRDISFVKFDDKLLLMNFALANLDHHTDVRRWDGSYEPLININERSYQEALKRAKAMLRTAMVNHGVAEVAAPKSSSGGTIFSESDEKARIVASDHLKKALNELFELRRSGEIKHMPQEVGVEFDLATNPPLASELEQILNDFKDRVEAEFGDKVTTYLSNRPKDLTQSAGDSRDVEKDDRIYTLLLDNNRIAMPKSSSGGMNYVGISAHHALNTVAVEDFKKQIESMNPKNTTKIITKLLFPVKGDLLRSASAAMNEFRISAKEKYGIVVETALLPDKDGMTLSIGGYDAKLRDIPVQNAETVSMNRTRKASSGGVISDTELDPAIKLSLQKHLNRLLELRRDPKTESITKQLGIPLELPATAFMDDEIMQIIERFSAQMKAEFGENIVYNFIYPTNDFTQSVKGSRNEEGYSDSTASILLVMTSSKSAAIKSSSGGTSVPGSDKRLAIQKMVIQSKLDWLYSEREAIKTTGLKEELRTRITLPSDQFISIGMKDILKAFRSRIQKDFSEDVKTTTTGYADEGGGTIDVLVSIQPDSDTAATKSSSGGTIIGSRAEKIATLIRNTKENVAVLERFDQALAGLDRLGGEAAVHAKEIFADVHKKLNSRLDDDIKQILNNPDPAISLSDTAALKNMVSILHQAEQYIRNINAITYADDGKLEEDTTPRVVILPATTAILYQASVAKNEIEAIQENLGVITIVSDNPLGVIKDIKSGEKLFEHNGIEVKVPASNIAVLLIENQRAIVSEVNRALGTKNTLIMNNIYNSQYVPFSQLAMLAKVQLILNKLGVTSQEAGPYRSAFLAMWKSITGNVLPGTIEQFMANPADYVISILLTPESVLNAVEIELLHNKAAKIWA